MSRVIFMCGPAGSGKSTIARQLAEQGMYRLSIDQTAWAQGHRTMPLAEDAQGAIVRQLRRHLLQLVEEDQDVVVDLAFPSRAMRDH